MGDGGFWFVADAIEVEYELEGDGDREFSELFVERSFSDQLSGVIDSELVEGEGVGDLCAES